MSSFEISLKLCRRNELLKTCIAPILWTRGPWATSLSWETVSVNKYIFAKLWIYHNVDYKEKKYLLFENVPYMWKLESPWPNVALRQIWFKLAQWLWRKISWIVFSLFHYYLLLENGVALHLNKVEFPLPRMLCAKIGWNWPSGSAEEDENWKKYIQTLGRTTDYQRS